jgi:hypothetical protein
MGKSKFIPFENPRCPLVTSGHEVKLIQRRQPAIDLQIRYLKNYLCSEFSSCQ